MRREVRPSNLPCRICALSFDRWRLGCRQMPHGFPILGLRRAGLLLALLALALRLDAGAAPLATPQAWGAAGFWAPICAAGHDPAPVVPDQRAALCDFCPSGLLGGAMLPSAAPSFAGNGGVWVASLAAPPSEAPPFRAERLAARPRAPPVA